MDCTLDSHPASEVDLLEESFDFNMGMLEDTDADLQVIEKRAAWERLSGLKPRSPQASCPAPAPDSESVLALSKASAGQNPFLREPLVDKSRSNSTAKLDWVSPASHRSSLYYFTSKKNDQDFSFDRSAVQVSRNLGRELFLQGLSRQKQPEPSGQKENFPVN